MFRSHILSFDTQLIVDLGVHAEVDFDAVPGRTSSSTWLIWVSRSLQEQGSRQPKRRSTARYADPTGHGFKKIFWPFRDQENGSDLVFCWKQATAGRTKRKTKTLEDCAGGAMKENWSRSTGCRNRQPRPGVALLRLRVGQHQQGVGPARP